MMTENKQKVQYRYRQIYVTNMYKNRDCMGFGRRLFSVVCKKLHSAYILASRSGNQKQNIFLGVKVQRLEKQL